MTTKVSPLQKLMKESEDFMGTDKVKTKVKFLKEVDAESSDFDDGLISLSMYECCTCHWRFFGDVVRFGHGYDFQGQQTPNYCPMCGKSIADEFAE